MLGEDTHLWFGIDYLPGVKDIDLLLWHEGVGVFVIEVKAVHSIDAFESFSFRNCKISGRGQARSPHMQAHAASEDLRSYLSSRNVRPPFVIATSVFPFIARADWNDYWDAEDITGDFAEKILFADDFAAGPIGLKNRLAKIWLTPPARTGSSQAWEHQKDLLRDFDKAVAPPDAKPQPTKSDRDRLAAIERDVAKKAIDEVPAFGGDRVGFVGHPGTGKTFRLLQIGAAHADQQAEVLFLCFNKVLAADIRRLLQWSPRWAGGKEHIFDVFDVHQLLNLRLAERGLGKSSDDQDANDYGIAGVELLVELQEEEEIATYDTVLLDEAQDLSDWQVQLAELHLREGGTFAIGIGMGQELYQGGLSERLKALTEEIETTSLHRNFRNTKEIFQTAFVAQESELDPEKIRASMRRFREIQGKHQGLGFDRKGRLPTLKPIASGTPSAEDGPKAFYVDQEKEMLVEPYSQLIVQELAQLDEHDQPIDLLILVPGENSPEAAAAREALRRIDQEYFDLTVAGSRRAIVPSTAVRLCTFHSARGIEANRVLIFGFARLEGFCRPLRISPGRLAYVILSRSVFETTIAVRPDEWESDVIVFMQEALTELQRR